MGEHVARDHRAHTAVEKAKAGQLPEFGSYTVSEFEGRYEIRIPPIVVDHHGSEDVVPHWDAENGFLVLDLEASDEPE